MKVKKDAEKPKLQPHESDCDEPHTECPNSWKGSCSRPAGHDGSHFCSRCNSYF